MQKKDSQSLAIDKDLYYLAIIGNDLNTKTTTKMPSISQLAKSIKLLSSSLEKRGFTCKVHVWRSGQKGIPSVVELDVKWGDNYLGYYEFLANGYKGDNKTDEFGGKSIKTMKEQFFEKFNKHTHDTNPNTNQTSQGKPQKAF